MSGLISIAGLWGAEKAVALTGYTRHQHLPGPIAPDFIAPKRAPSLTFSPLALAAAVARTETTRDDAPLAVLNALQRSTLPMLKAMVEDGTTFGLSSNFQYLADTERTFFAARIGGGITDLYMNALRYTWRANAACLSSALDPHPDFIYEGGNASGHGVVLAEAHGSFAANASAQSVHQKSKSKYLRQVKPHLGATSRHGKVIHGYSIAFGAAPSAPGAFLSLSETKITKPKAKGLPPPILAPEAPPVGATPMSIALAAHRSNFFLMGYDYVVDWIDWVRAADGAPPEPVPINFLKIQYDGRQYLVHPFWPYAPHCEWPEGLPNYQYPWNHARPVDRRWLLCWFAMEETAGATFLNALTSIIQDDRRSIPATFQLPTFEAIGFGIGSESAERTRDDTPYQYALFRDGLALLGAPKLDLPPSSAKWSPREGYSRNSPPA